MQDKPFLERLAPEDRAALDALLVSRRYGREETVITQSEGGSDVFFVLEGLARATLFSEDGRVVAYRDIGEGAIFGEISAIDSGPRSASVVAVSDLHAGRLSARRFRELIEANKSFAWALLEHLAMQSRRMTGRIFEFSTMLVRERLVQELVRLAEAAVAEGRPAELRPAPTHFELAARLSTHREAISREMSRLSKLGLVSKKGGALIVHDPEGLRALRDKVE